MRSASEKSHGRWFSLPPVPGKAAWHTKPSWFVIAANDRTISPEQEKRTAERMGAATLTLATSHVAMLAKPEEVADFIVEASASEKAAASARLPQAA